MPRGGEDKETHEGRYKKGKGKYDIHRIPEFTNASRNGARCSLSGLSMYTRKPGRQDHEVDDFILRGPAIHREGYFDFKPSVLRGLALEYTDLIEPQILQDLQDLEAQLAEAQNAMKALEEEAESLRNLLIDQWDDDDLKQTPEDSDS